MDQAIELTVLFTTDACIRCGQTAMYQNPAGVKLCAGCAIITATPAVAGGYGPGYKFAPYTERDSLRCRHVAYIKPPDGGPENRWACYAERGHDGLHVGYTSATTIPYAWTSSGKAVYRDGTWLTDTEGSPVVVVKVSWYDPSDTDSPTVATVVTLNKADIVGVYGPVTDWDDEDEVIDAAYAYLQDNTRVFTTSDDVDIDEVTLP